MNDYTPKYFAKLSKNKTWYCSRSCGADGMGKEKQCNNLADVFTEMEEWAKSGIWYCHLKPIQSYLENQLKELGFSVYEYFGNTGVSWHNAKFGGMVPFKKEKHLLSLESGDVVCGSLNGERLNFYMRNKTHAVIGDGYGEISIIENVINGNLILREIQKKSYWED